MAWGVRSILLAYFSVASTALKYEADFVDWNLNQNQTATDPIDYWGEWTDHTYTESPKNWRYPTYTLFLDRWVNGDPTNDNANGTHFEHDLESTQLRNGGDVAGLIDSLDYLQGMGIKVSQITNILDHVQAQRWPCFMNTNSPAPTAHLYCWLTVHQSTLGC